MNSQPQTPAISSWLQDATAQLVAADISSARLDAEIILAHTIKKSRTYLHAHDDEKLTSRQTEIADARLQLRLDRTPIAYIIGHKEFYGRLFKVTPATLIPRPESEIMIEILNEILPQSAKPLPAAGKKLVDVGTGSGILGITAKLEHPELDVTLCDVSRHALNVAETNARNLKADVRLLPSNLLGDYPFSPDYILANLPYVDPLWQRSPETIHEPAVALFADNHGLALIDQLIKQAETSLAAHGHLLLEADPRQHADIIATAKNHSFRLRETRDFIVSLQKN